MKQSPGSGDTARGVGTGAGGQCCTQLKVSLLDYLHHPLRQPGPQHRLAQVARPKTHKELVRVPELLGTQDVFSQGPDWTKSRPRRRRHVPPRTEPTIEQTNPDGNLTAPWGGKQDWDGGQRMTPEPSGRNQQSEWTDKECSSPTRLVEVTASKNADLRESHRRPILEQLKDQS